MTRQLTTDQIRNDMRRRLDIMRGTTKPDRPPPSIRFASPAWHDLEERVAESTWELTRPKTHPSHQPHRKH